MSLNLLYCVLVWTKRTQDPAAGSLHDGGLSHTKHPFSWRTLKRVSTRTHRNVYACTDALRRVKSTQRCSSLIAANGGSNTSARRSGKRMTRQLMHCRKDWQQESWTWRCFWGRPKGSLSSVTGTGSVWMQWKAGPGAEKITGTTQLEHLHIPGSGADCKHVFLC